jgi:uncharacterized membrane protein
VKLESYRQVLRAVTAFMGVVVAAGVALNSLLLPLVGVTAGMLLLYAARRTVQETSHDERTVLIQQKAAQATLSMTIIATAFIGLGLMLLSRQGLLSYEQQGYQLAFLSLFIMSAKAFFDWYYKNRLGG